MGGAWMQFGLLFRSLLLGKLPDFNDAKKYTY